MCHLSSSTSTASVSVEEPAAAEESFVLYCKLVELYNILKRRACCNPSFLPRCLNYKINSKWKSSLMDSNVIFTYKDQSSLHRKTEVTRQFSCSFCLMKCGSFKGLRSHLLTSHDRFKCEFWVTDEYRAVIVSINTDTVNSESEDTVSETESDFQPFYYCSKPRKRQNPKAEHVLEPPIVSERLVNVPLESNGEDEKDLVTCANKTELLYSRDNSKECENGSGASKLDYGPATSEVSVTKSKSLEEVDCVEKSVVDHPVIPSAKSKKLSFESSETKRLTKHCAPLLLKRQFFHSHKVQPMALEQVLSDIDSETEEDGYVADLEDRRMLDEFLDITKDEKHLMHLWNSFVSKQRILADGHIPWACEAFLRLHGKKLIASQTLFWCWRLFMIKLWNHKLLNARTMNKCSMILQEFQDEAIADEK